MYCFLKAASLASWSSTVRLASSSFFQAEDGIRDTSVTGVQTCALPICTGRSPLGLFARICTLPSTPDTPTGNRAAPYPGVWLLRTLSCASVSTKARSSSSASPARPRPRCASGCSGEISLYDRPLLVCRDERGFDGIAVAYGNVLQAHAQDFMGNAVFVVQIGIQHFRVVGVDRDLNSLVKQLLERVIVNPLDRTRQVVAPGTHLQRNSALQIGRAHV